ncbi:MAG: putative lipid II flippase FtsW [Gammaproteobacteria bacterium]|nr:putative lipid II flippase FtsW [Gammaproteobacteria bacterium]
MQRREGKIWEMPRLDYPLLATALALLLIGVVMVGSATMHRFTAMPYFFVYRHLFAVLLGLAVAAVVMRIPIDRWERWAPLLYILGLVLLVLVLIPGIGRSVNGAQRWISLGGFNLQSSEFMKLFVMLYLAGYLNRKHLEVTTGVWGFVKPLLPVLIAAALIMLEPDMGTTVVLLVIAFGMLFLGGVPIRQYLVLFAVAIVSLGVLVIVEPYRMKRVTSFMDPFADPLNSGYQLSNALIAFGRGEWSGVGLGEGVQKLFYLPEAHNDFLIAVIGEEFGLLGTVSIILLFAFISWRAFRIGAMAEKQGKRFALYIAYGSGLWIGFQAFINIGVNLGLLPTKGLTLPLMSYGGNSIIVVCVVIAMLQRIHLEVVPTTPKRSKK